eukprot:6184807-Pleurochrysis_carterae.AAC.2
MPAAACGACGGCGVKGGCGAIVTFSAELSRLKGDVRPPFSPECAVLPSDNRDAESSCPARAEPARAEPALADPPRAPP